MVQVTQKVRHTEQTSGQAWPRIHGTMGWMQMKHGSVCVFHPKQLFTPLSWTVGGDARSAISEDGSRTRDSEEKIKVKNSLRLCDVNWGHQSEKNVYCKSMNSGKMLHYKIGSLFCRVLLLWTHLTARYKLLVSLQRGPPVKLLQEGL